MQFSGDAESQDRNKGDVQSHNNNQRTQVIQEVSIYNSIKTVSNYKPLLLIIKAVLIQ
jgi:hypothetical protein